MNILPDKAASLLMVLVLLLASIQYWGFAVRADHSNGGRGFLFFFYPNPSSRLMLSVFSCGHWLCVCSLVILWCPDFLLFFNRIVCLSWYVLVQSLRHPYIDIHSSWGLCFIPFPLSHWAEFWFQWTPAWLSISQCTIVPCFMGTYLIWIVFFSNMLVILH